MLQVLVVEDHPEIARLVSAVLADEEVSIQVVTDRFARLLEPQWWHGIDVALIDYLLGDPDLTGADIATAAADAGVPTVVIHTVLDATLVDCDDPRVSVIRKSGDLGALRDILGPR